MDIETISIRGPIDDYLIFGYQLSDDVRVRHGRIHHTEHILVRDKNMKNYSLIRQLEASYFSLKRQLKTYKEIDKGTCLVLFLLFIIPGILYVVFKKEQKQSIDDYNQKIKAQMYRIESKAAELL